MNRPTLMPSTSANSGYCRLVTIVPAISSGFTPALGKDEYARADEKAAEQNPCNRQGDRRRRRLERNTPKNAPLPLAANECSP